MSLVVIAVNRITTDSTLDALVFVAESSPAAAAAVSFYSVVVVVVLVIAAVIPTRVSTLSLIRYFGSPFLCFFRLAARTWNLLPFSGFLYFTSFAFGASRRL